VDPTDPAKVAGVFGTRVAETILASVHVRARQQAGHMDASDLIKPCRKTLARRGPSTYGVSIMIGVRGPIIRFNEINGLILLSQSVAAFAEKNHIFEKTYLFSMRRG
jgi:hypothetical protein